MSCYFVGGGWEILPFLISFLLSVLSPNRRTGCVKASQVLWIVDLVSLSKEVNLLLTLFSLRFSVVAALPHFITCTEKYS